MLWDTRLLLAINVQWHHPFVTAVMARVTWLGDQWVVLAAVLAGLWGWRRRREVVAAGVGALTMFPVVAALKVVVQRPRPAGIPGLWIASPESTPSFPSGHAAGAFALAAMLSLAWPRGRALWWTAAVVVAWSRVALGVHYPSDCLAGAAIGVSLVFGTVWIVTRQKHAGNIGLRG